MTIQKTGSGWELNKIDFYNIHPPDKNNRLYAPIVHVHCTERKQICRQKKVQ